MQKVEIHSDGGCVGNPGPGGWAAVLDFGAGNKRELSGGEPATTNNRMELRAAIEALRSLTEPSQVVFHTDSEYVRKGISSWLAGWKANGWRTKNKHPVKNADLWRALDGSTAGHSISWRWVKGHSGNEGNERCDVLAGEAITDIQNTFSADELMAALAEFRQATSDQAITSPAQPEANLPLLQSFTSQTVKTNPSSKTVTLYIDGGCHGGTGPGAWAALLTFGDHKRELSGGEFATNFFRMALRAVIEGFGALKKPCQVDVFTDAEYIGKGATLWLPKWRANNWRISETKPIKNADLWRELDAAIAGHTISWHWAKGHSGQDGVNWCHKLTAKVIATIKKNNSAERLKAALVEFRQQPVDPRQATLKL